MADNEEYSRDAGSADNYSETGDTISNVEWRSVEQVENGTPSTSPFWDTDSDEDGPKPSELYGKHTWKIENFSKINGRELRSEPFDAGGYKWYILIYPKGCDVCNHISLFLCVANHDKLLPGWSHFAQFTIAVVNNDQKKSKYSDTLHRFWKKEHDWGWKKFMELSKVQEGFLVDGNLVIKAQVQVIREKADRPFRCLDRLYRRELVRIYMTNIENIYRKFVEEKRNRLSKLIEDKSRWASFHGFWSGTSVSVKNCMSRERSDVILKIIVKHFFIEKEVTSTLVMDSLYSGLRALELQSIKGKKWRGSMPSELEMMPPLMVRVDRDMFVLADDVITLLERVVLEPVPPVKDDKVSQNRTTKDGTTIDEMSRDTNERDERRLTEIGRRILEIFTLAHIYSIIEVAYQEAIALKRQEELIREEEAWMNEPDTKSKRDNKDKKSKKKQGKQKKNNKKCKEKEKEEKPIVEDPPEETEELNEDGSENGEDVTNGDDASNGGELLAEPEAVDLEVRESNPVNKDYEITKDEWTGKKSYGSSSINNDNWVPVGSSNKGMNSSNYKNHSSPNRGKTQRNKSVNERPTPLPIVTNTNEKMGPTHVTVPTVLANSNVTPGASNDSGSSNGRARTPQPKQKPEQRVIETQPIISMQKKVEPKSQPQPQPQIVFMAPSKPATPTATPSSATLNPSTKPFVPFKPTPPSSSTPRPVLSSATFPVASPRPVGPPPSPKREPVNPLPKGPIPFTPVMQTRVMPEPVNLVKNMSSPRASSQASIVSRPLSAPVVVSHAGPRPVTPMVAPIQVSSYLTRSVSAMNRVGTDPSPSPSPSAPSFIPQSYRSAITGSNVNNNSNNNSLTGLNLNLNLNSHPNPIGFAIQGSLLQARLNSGIDMISGTGTESNLSFFSSAPSFNRPQHNENGPLYPDYSVPDSQTIAEEFPHMDIINDVLDGELYRPRDGTLGRSYHPFPVSRPELHLDSPIGLNRVDPLRDMGLTGGSSRVDQIRDMGLFSGSSQVGPYRDMGLTGRSSRVDPLRDMAHMGMTSGSSRVDSLRDMGLASGSALVEPMRDMSLASGSGRVDPLWDTGMLNSRVYGSSSSSLRDGGHSSLFNNNVPSYHHVNGHYDYSNDLGMNLNMGVDLNNGYGIRDYSHLQGPSGLNRFRYPHDNGR